MLASDRVTNHQSYIVTKTSKFTCTIIDLYFSLLFSLSISLPFVGQIYPRKQREEIKP